MRITLSIDDGTKDDIRIAKLCDKYGIDCLFYWPVDIEGVCMLKGWEPVSPKDEAWIARNFEIGSHTVTHRYLTQIPLGEAIYEIVDSKIILEDKYDQNITKFAYPRGYANETLVQAVKDAGYTYARSTEIGHIGKPDNALFAQTAVHIGCPVRKEYSGTTWLEYGMELLEQARAEDKDFEGWMHSWEVTRYNEWGNVEKFIKELARG
jgi:hypothetical protein